MMRAVKTVSTYRGRDPRDCVLMAFGGNGGIFAFELARQLQMKTVLVPPVAGVFSAYGLGVAEVEYSQTRGFPRQLESTSASEVEGAVRELKEDVSRHLERQDVTFTAQAAMRYVGQAFELRVPLTELKETAERFEKEHEATYGHRMEQGSPIEFVALEVIGTVRDQRASADATPQRSRKAVAEEKRRCYFGPDVGFVEARVIGREALKGDTDGPLIVEEYEGTTVVPPGASACLDAHGNIVIGV
jgi:N-methylhydantoinase A